MLFDLFPLLVSESKLNHLKWNVKSEFHNTSMDQALSFDKELRSKLVADFLQVCAWQHVKEDTSLKPQRLLPGGGCLPLLEPPVVKNISFRDSYHPQYPICPIWCWTSFLKPKTQQLFFHCWALWIHPFSPEKTYLANMSFLRWQKYDDSSGLIWAIETEISDLTNKKTLSL